MGGGGGDVQNGMENRWTSTEGMCVFDLLFTEGLFAEHAWGAFEKVFFD